MLDTNDKQVELYNQRVMNYAVNLLLRSDLQTMQHITIKDILDDNNLNRVTLNR